MMFSIGILSFVFLIDPYCVSKLKCSRILQGSQTSVLVVNHLFKWEKTRLPILILGAHLGHLWSFYSLLTGRFAIQNYSLKSITNDWPNWLDIIPVFLLFLIFYKRRSCQSSYLAILICTSLFIYTTNF